MVSSRREKISAVDTAWLRMDRPNNLMMISGVLLLRGRVPFARLLATIDQRFLRFRRFRQRPIQSAGLSYWETDPAFQLEAHVVRIALPGNAGTAELQTLMSDLTSTPLDPARPLWQFHFVDNFEGGGALIARIHHCYADGIALIQVMLSMTDAAKDGPPAMPAPPTQRERGTDDDALTQFTRPVAGAVKMAMKVGTTLIEKGVALWHEPAKAATLAGQGSALTGEIAKLALMGQDSPTRFKGKPGVRKQVAWAEPIPLPDVKTIGKALQASVNDVLLSCVAGALRSYCVQKGDPVEGVTIRALVPVNMRPLEKAYRLGNQFGLVFLDLPIGIENPVERLYAVRSNMNALKGSYQPILSLGLLAAMGAGPRMLQDQLLKMLARNASAVMTNVPGPQQPLYLAGAKIDDLMFWVPQSGDIGMGVSILSYDGRVQFGLFTDRKLCPDPERVIETFVPEFDKLVLATLMSPWPWDGDLDPLIAQRAVNGLRATPDRCWAPGKPLSDTD